MQPEGRLPFVRFGVPASYLSTLTRKLFVQLGCALLLCVACGIVSTVGAQVAGEKGVQDPAKPANPYLPQPKGDAWLDLTTGKIISANAVVKPSGPIIWGRLVKKAFEPLAVVDFMESATEPDPEFMPGWIELRTGKIHRDVEAVAPQRPYLHGRIDKKNLFHVDPVELKNWASKQTEPPPASQPPADAWLLLLAGKIEKGPETPKADSPIIQGQFVNGQFEPSRNVIGPEPLEPDEGWMPGWIELRDGSIHQDIEGRAPQRPYLKGRIDPQGRFHVYPDELKKWAAGETTPSDR